MGFRKDAFAKVWSIEPLSDMKTKLRISVSRKDKQTGEYIQDFSGFVECIGTAVAKKAAKLNEGDRIRLGDTDVSTRYDKEKKITYTNFKVFSFDADGEDEKSGGSSRQADTNKSDVSEEDESGKKLPF